MANRRIKNPNFKGKRKRKTARNFSQGGYLVGPSHEQGGIQAIVDGTEPIEVEGGEFIINKQTVDAVGEEFLHKLNSTETTHHTGGFEEGQLPGPSNFKKGARTTGRGNMRNNRRKRMGAGGRSCGGMGQPPCNGGGYRRGGRTRPVPKGRKMAPGGRAHGSCPEGMVHSPTGGCMRAGGRAGGRNRAITARGVGRKILEKGGQIRQSPKGGNTFYGNNSACTMYTSKFSCNKKSGCNWDIQTDMCR